MKGALSFTTIVLGMSAASAFVGFEIQHTGSRTFRVPKQIGLQRMASAAPAESDIPDSVMEEVWRYVKKPLISVGGKGATNKHGNSLRQLLNDHTAVKVKVNTKSFGKLKNIFCLGHSLASRIKKFNLLLNWAYASQKALSDFLCAFSRNISLASNTMLLL